MFVLCINIIIINNNNNNNSKRNFFLKQLFENKIPTAFFVRILLVLYISLTIYSFCNNFGACPPLSTPTIYSPPLHHHYYHRSCSYSTHDLHILELVYATLRVALADLSQRLVLVAALAHVLPMDLVVGRLHRLVSRLRQVHLKGLKKDFEKLFNNFLLII